MLLPDRGSVRKHYDATIERCAPLHAGQARRLFERISSPAWNLEWSLPRYLGEAFELPETVILTLVLANVYGLGCIRLRDDLADAETRKRDLAGSTILADLFYQEAIHCYEELFSPSSRFWSYLERYMNQWQEATFAGGRIESLDLAGGLHEQYEALAHKGAPLKIGCVAACMQADRVTLIEQVTSSVDHALAAAVLFDHVYDWSEDLAAGRFNLFVKRFARFPQTRAHTKANELEVMEAIVADRTAPYFDLIRRETDIAIRMSNSISVPGLAGYLETFKAQVGAFETVLRNGAHGVLEAACDLLFGDPPPGGAMPGNSTIGGLVAGKLR